MVFVSEQCAYVQLVVCADWGDWKPNLICVSVSPFCLTAVMFLIILKHTYTHKQTETHTRAVRKLEQAGFLHKTACVLGKTSHTPWVLKPVIPTGLAGKKMEPGACMSIHTFMCFCFTCVGMWKVVVSVFVYVCECFSYFKTIGSHRLGVNTLNTLYFSSRSAETCCHWLFPLRPKLIIKCNLGQFTSVLLLFSDQMCH